MPEHFCLTQGLLTTKGGERVLPAMANRGRFRKWEGRGFHFQASGVIQG